ncbi:MAG TPA: SURF1 family protein [Aeromicrobium sp.]|nr:SURF1 family protein [Aeromicrobium sp.]
MSLRSWFTPAMLGLHAFWAVAVVVCTLGGLWQMGVYESRQDEAIDHSRTEGVVDIGQVWSVGEAFPSDLSNRTVTVAGRFGDAADQLWVVGPATDGRAWIVAPFWVDGSDAALLVVRGSQAEVGDLPDVPDGELTLTVSLQPSVSGAGPLDENRVTTSVTVATLLNELPYRLWSGYGIVTDGSPPPDGATLVQPPDPDVSWTVGLKNLAYALQWWVFAAFSVFMWWRMLADQADKQSRTSRPVA